MSMARRPGGLSLRPLVVRFTDPMMEDAHMDLVYERVDDEVERRWPDLIELTVGQVKERTTGKRLRLIYLGRVLPNGVRLASWLDATAQEDEPGQSMTLLLEREPLSDHTFIMKRADQGLGDVSDKQRGKQRLLDFDMDGEGVHEHDILCLPTAFLQCSIGPSTDEVQPTKDALIPSTTNEARGFDRLRYTAGMSPLDVQTMREQFHLQSGLSTAYTGDLIRQEDEQEYAYRLEEQWIDNMGTAPIRSHAPSIPMSILQGLLIGFFFPLNLASLSDLAPQLEARQEQMAQAAPTAEQENEARPTTAQPSEQERRDLQQTLTTFTDLLRMREAQPTNDAASMRNENDDPDADDDADDEPSVSQRFLLRPSRVDRYVVFQPYTLLAIFLGFLSNLFWRV
ncbi:hypothetical protein MNAN1_002581 [Malassezia nana]|uniref:Uncharacterized protein n=1 Tax=Malassezia nana TaxID=180528 RepID=A0AAF0EMJ7_9BASI|nr:hypothetical protein MNAN1_002581 [Malassezia nana]